MTPELYSLIIKIFNDNINKKFNLLILGDEKQNIFSFKNADSRYLTLSHILFKHINNKPWKSLKLSITYRLSYNIVQFINNNILHYNWFNTNNQPGKVIFLLFSP